MEYTKEIYESEYGYGYRIFINGKLTIIQPHAPGVPGLVGMTSSEADKYADELIEEMNAPPEEVPENNRVAENVRLAEEMMEAAQKGDEDAFDRLRNGRELKEREHMTPRGVRVDEPNPN